MKTEFDILIVGAGLAGLTTALACADSGATVALLDRKAVEVGSDGRASALSTTSLRLFENLGVDLKGLTQPIKDMLVTECAPNSPWRLHFEGDGDGGDLGALVENAPLKAALLKQVKLQKGVSIFAPIGIQDIARSAKNVMAETDQGTLTAKLLIAADGRDSLLRRKAGITTQRFDYDSASLVTTISHELPHDGLAWQRLIPGGALAVLPLTGQRSQIVWSGPTAGIQAATAMDDDSFVALLSEKMDGYLGDMSIIAQRQCYPLRLQMADGFTAIRLALVGDAAHVIHPLAGQGFNLGIRDAAAIADGVKMARDTGQDIGVASLLEYDHWRNADSRSLGVVTHLISETSRRNSGSIGHIRRLGLALTNRSTATKSALVKRASGEARELPTLMRQR
jgi:2-octaprenyl-6-methoxyphenol hydroxylase